MRGISGNAQQFAQGDAELCNYEAEHDDDDADAGANPGEEGALVGEMAARFAGGYRRPRESSWKGNRLHWAGETGILVERLVALQCEHQRWAESLYTFDGGRTGRRIATRNSKPKYRCRAKSPGAICIPLNLRPI